MPPSSFVNRPMVENYHDRDLNVSEIADLLVCSLVPSFLSHTVLKNGTVCDKMLGTRLGSMNKEVRQIIKQAVKN